MSGTRGSASPWPERQRGNLSLSPEKRRLETVSPATSRRTAFDDRKEVIDEEDANREDDVLPVLPELEADQSFEFGEDFMLGSVDAPLWDVDPDVSVIEGGKGKGNANEDIPRIRVAREVVMVGWEAYRIWREIPEVKEALETVAIADNAGHQEEEETANDKKEAVVEGEKETHIHEGEEVKVEEDSWQSVLRTRCQQAELDAANSAGREETRQIEMEKQSISLNLFHHGTS